MDNRMDNLRRIPTTAAGRPDLSSVRIPLVKHGLINPVSQHGSDRFSEWSKSSHRFPVGGLTRIEDNTRVALERLLTIDPVMALALASSLNVFWWTQGKLREGISWLGRARQAAPDAPAELLATSLFCEAFLVAHDTDDWHAAAELIDDGIKAISISDIGDPPLILGMLLCLRGECDVFNGDPESAVVRAEDGYQISLRYPGAWGSGFCAWNLANARRAVGDEDAAVALFEECHEVGSTHGYGIAEMVACNDLGTIWEGRGVLDTARTYWERALQLRRELGALRIGYVHGTMPTNLLAVARVAEKQGDLATTSRLLREGLPLAEAMREAEIARLTELLRKTSHVEPTQRAMLRPEGGTWHIDFGSPAEKARLNVTRTIRHAITDLATRAPELAAHLNESIVTGVSCCYEPRADITWTT